MIKYLKIAVDPENGEAWFTKKSVETLKSWTDESIVLGADIASDIMCHAEEIYMEIIDQWRLMEVELGTKH